MEYKELNISKVIITAISALILVIIIAVLTKVLTSKKQAAEVVSENPQTQVATEENVWKTTTNESTNASKEATANNNQESNTNNIQVENNQEVNTNNVQTTENNQEVNTNNAQTIENNQEVNEKNAQTGENQETNTNNVQTGENQKANANNAQTGENQKANTNGDQAQTNQNSNNEPKVNEQNAVNTSATTEKNKSTEGVIWLTFDDGPSANITPKILDILKKENVKATFFVINYSDNNEHLLKRIVAEGHTIGIHGYSHEYSKIYKSKETFMKNVYTLQDRIYKSTGVKTMYTRFPGGSSNTVSRKYCKGIMTELTKEMLAKGFKYYDWNISSGDAGGAKNAKDVYKNVTKNLSKKRGNMVLMHDFGGNKKGLEALPEIIKYAKKEGYTFARIDDDTPMYAQHVNN
ncbi:MAG: polysaccharide deacetylase family protein [Clostridia bacterium]|nr:polysaccharide deacetylase family protein [Clostridia bacterium]